MNLFHCKYCDSDSYIVNASSQWHVIKKTGVKPSLGISYCLKLLITVNVIVNVCKMREISKGFSSLEKVACN